MTYLIMLFWMLYGILMASVLKKILDKLNEKYETRHNTKLPSWIIVIYYVLGFFIIYAVISLISYLLGI